GAGGWDGVSVELQRFHDVDAVLQFNDHIVAVHVAGTINLLQRRNGKSYRRSVGPGDIIITPVGEPKRWQHTGENVVVLVRLSPAFVQNVAGDEFALDPARLEIRDNFGTRDAHIATLRRGRLGGRALRG